VYAQVYSSSNSVGVITVTNNTIHGNRAGQYGGGIETYSYGKLGAGPVNVYNNIVTGNTSGYGGADIMLQNLSGEAYGYNNSYHGLSGTWTNQRANIDADPVFVSPGHWDDSGTPADPADDIWVGGDYHLTLALPALTPVTTPRPNFRDWISKATAGSLTEIETAQRSLTWERMNT